MLIMTFSDHRVLMIGHAPQNAAKHEDECVDFSKATYESALWYCLALQRKHEVPNGAMLRVVQLQRYYSVALHYNHDDMQERAFALQLMNNLPSTWEELFGEDPMKHMQMENDHASIYTVATAVRYFA